MLARMIGLIFAGSFVLASTVTAWGQPAGQPPKDAGLNLALQRLWLDQDTTVRKTPLTTKEVDPRHMYSAFVNQYQLGPDPRWALALQDLIQLNMRWNQQGAPSYSLGSVIFNNDITYYPLFKDDRLIVKLELPTSADFPAGLAMLQKAAAAMGWQLTGVSTENRGDDLEARLITWRDRFYSMDPRGIIRALINLEGVRGASAASTLNAKLWATAAVGYTMLGLSLTPDVMDFSDTCYSQALAYLALGKHLEPGLSTVREESFLAMGLGYKAYARTLLEKQTFASDDMYSSIITAYLLGDVAGLRKLHERNPVPLSYCLLGRLYRYMELWGEAKALAERFLKEDPRSYASMIAAINDGDLTLGHSLTVVYPLDILARLKENVSGDADREDKSAWVERARGVSGEESGSDFSFQQFDELLEKWVPWGWDINTGVIIDSTRIKAVYRALYSDALYLRFYFLLERWNVTERASTFVKSLAKTDMNHPLVLNMRMLVADESSDRASVDRLAARVVQHPQTTAPMAVNALYKFSSYLDKVKYAPQVFGKVTGKPRHIYLAGVMFSEIWHFDWAVKMFRQSLERDPFDFECYRQLAYKEGDASAVEEAIQKYSFNYKVMRSAGDYYAEQTDPQLLEKALDCYDKAMAIVPGDLSLAEDKAGVLRKLKRYEEAIRLLKEWLAKYSANDMATLYYKNALAINYLKVQDSKAALEVLTPEVIGSYQGGVMLTAAWAHDALNEQTQAEDLFRKVVERYPTSDGVLEDRIEYLWKHQRDQEAVDLITKARPRHGEKNYWWYFDAVRTELGQAPKERVLKVVDALLAGGAPENEIKGLALQCFQKDHELAYEIMSRMPASNPMMMLWKVVGLYPILKDWQGEEAADKFFDQNVPPQAMGPLSMLLYNNGLYELLLRKLPDPDSYPPPHREFTWLEKILAWEALDRKPEGFAKDIAEHYKQPSTDYYNTLARFILGQVKLEELLDIVATSKQRCEFAYYIGFSRRMAKEYEEAANWYYICLETQLINNGELHWAMEELFWWGHLGAKHRNRLKRDDLADFWKKKLAESQLK